MTAPSDSPSPAPARRALPLALAALVLLLAIGVVGLLSRENDSSPVDDVSAALEVHAAALAGPLNVTALQHTRCEATSRDQQFVCTPVMNNASEQVSLTVRYADGTLTKQLAGSALTSAPTTGDAVAAALNADERATLGRTVRYGCAFTSGLNPDGSQRGNSAGGFRCATAKPLAGQREPLQRYVEFAADGFVTYDFMLADGQ